MKQPDPQKPRRWAAIMLLLLTPACGSVQQKDDGRFSAAEAEARRLEMDPLHVAATQKKDGSITTRVFDARELFEEGQSAFAAKDYQKCDEAFGQLVKEFSASRYFHSALYNQGLCAEGLKAHQRAVELFEAHIQGATSLEDKRDGQIRKGFNLIEAGQTDAAIRLYESLLKAPDLTPLDRAECLLRIGVALNAKTKRAEAERSLESAMKMVRQGTDGLVQGNDIFAEAHFRRGEIYQDLCHGIQLKLPLETMKNDLEEKVRFFRQAQKSYLDALNVRESYWATAAGMKLGELYEQFYEDVVAAQFPADFDDATREVYFKELRSELQPLLEQSLSIYERNLSMSLRLGAENEWVNETRTRLLRLRQILEENAQASLDESQSSAEQKAPASKSPRGE